MATTGRSKKTRSVLDNERYTADFTSGQLVIAICGLLLAALLCFLLGVSVGRYERGVERSRIAAVAEDVLPEASESAPAAVPSAPRVPEPAAKPAVPAASPAKPSTVPVAVPVAVPVTPPPAAKPEPVPTPTPAPNPVPAAVPPVAAPEPTPEPATTVAEPVPVPTAVDEPEIHIAPLPDQTGLPAATPPTPAPTPPAATSPAPAPAPAAAGATRYGIQLAAFGDIENARKARERLLANTELEADLVEAGKWIRVIIGDYKERKDAEAACAELKQRPGFRDCYVVPRTD